MNTIIPDERILKRLVDDDRAFLKALFTHRCLTESLAYRFFYSKTDVRRTYTTKRLQSLEALRLVEEVDYKSEFPALFLTNLGVKTAKYLLSIDSPAFVQTARHFNNVTASNLKLVENTINHQMHLNDFELEFESYAKEQVHSLYYDSKFMPPASDFMMPDGMIELPNCYLFLEMDMGTERTNRLVQKWNSYRSFLNSPGFFYQEKPIVMFFIVEGVKNIELRCFTVTGPLLTHIGNRIDGTFETYIASPDALHEVIRTQILGCDTETQNAISSLCGSISSQHGFVLSSPTFLNSLNVPIGYYARRLNRLKKIEILDGRPQECLMDIWMDGRLSVFRNIMYWRQTRNQLKSTVGRDMPYVLIVPSEKWANNVLKTINSPQPKGIYFTTPNRLLGNSWHNALFEIDQIGNLSHFKDASLSVHIHERRMPR